VLNSLLFKWLRGMQAMPAGTFARCGWTKGLPGNAEAIAFAASHGTVSSMVRGLYSSGHCLGRQDSFISSRVMCVNRLVSL